MSVAVTRDDFIKAGKRYTTEAIINEIDRLHPLALLDIILLEQSGYSKKLLSELEGFRDQLRSENADRRKIRGAKLGARAKEEEAIKDGAIVLRKGIAMANVSISRRLVPQDEDPQVTHETMTELNQRLEVLTGSINKDSAKLRTRLEALKSTLALPEFAPPTGDEEVRAKYLAKLESTIDRLGSLAEDKKSLKESSKDKTVALNGIEGQAYANLRLLTQVGKVAFLEAGDPEHAKMYALRNLHHGKHRTAVIPVQSDAVRCSPALPQCSATRDKHHAATQTSPTTTQDSNNLSLRPA